MREFWPKMDICIPLDIIKLIILFCDKSYMLRTTKQQLRDIHDLLHKQCRPLKFRQAVKNIQDKSLYRILAIGKENNNHPLLMYLVDAYNRYRIQKRKKLKRIWSNQDATFRKKFSDPLPDKFIIQKCNGIEEWLGNDYDEQELKQFKEYCHSAISIFRNRLLDCPPMLPYALTHVIDDNIKEICWYIFAAYSFIDQYFVQESGSLPCQIDLVIIVKDTYSRTYSDDDGDDEYDNENDQEEDESLGSIDDRLQGQKNVIKMDIRPWSGTAEGAMGLAISTILSKKRNQRGILIIDRREKNDILYGYQPNKEKNCHLIEKDRNKFLCESLFKNSRSCLIPKKENERIDIGIGHPHGHFMTLSFHCYSSNDIRVYLFYDGWGTRFFIEDIKYFLPCLVILIQTEYHDKK